MKKFAFCIMAMCLSFTFYPVQSKAVNTAVTTSKVITKSDNAAEAKVLLSRLNEIKTMDKSNLSSSDKKMLRVEVRSIRHRLREMGGGIYISAGALIVIILLLIILFH